MRQAHEPDTTVYAWKEEQWRIAVVGTRRVIAEIDIHVARHLESDFRFMRFEATDGDLDDIVALVSDPFHTKTPFAINAALKGGGITHLGTIDEGAIHGLVTPGWKLLKGPPLGGTPQPDLHSRLNKALLRNFMTLQNLWPKRRTPGLELTLDNTSAIPTLANRERIQGQGARDDPEARHFLKSGEDDLRCVINIAEVFGAPLGRNTRTLDWGVGCSRMARHLPSILRDGFVGADVDPVNIEWSRNNIGFGRFEVLQPDQLTPFEPGQFDLVYSHSVFTHLNETDQDFWLTELARITHRNGLMILSIQGLVHAGLVAPWARSPKLLADWMLKGFRDSGTPNPDIADVTCPEYYRDVAHTSDYIVKHWSEYVDVQDIVAGGFGPVHDAVVCRPKVK